MTEIYELPQGKITISFCDKNLSIGLLELSPNQALEKHNRPVDEELVQIHGSCVMKLFDGDKLVKEVPLNEGEKLEIPANQFHVHSNPTNGKSITLWKFEGNIVDVIENIRNSFKKIL
mgnify:CR=1 FL=1